MLKLKKVSTFLWQETKEALHNHECLPAFAVVGAVAILITVSAAGVLANIF